MTKNKWINRWIARPMDTAHLLTALALGFCYAAGLLMPSERLQGLGYWGIFLLILEYIAHKNLNAAYHFLNNTTEASTIPVQQIKGVNLAMLSIHTGFTVLAMLLVPLLGLERLLFGAKDALIWLVRSLVSFFPRHQAIPETAPMPEPEAAPSPFPPIAEGVTPRWLEILLQILEFVCTILAAALIAALFCYGIYQLYRKWIERQRYEGELREFVSPLSETRRQKPQKRSQTALWRDFSPSASMRRLYMRTLQKNKPKNLSLPASSTPAELETSVFGGAKNPLHEYYEKARYSREGCSQQDLEKVRKSL